MALTVSTSLKALFRPLAEKGFRAPCREFGGAGQGGVKDAGRLVSGSPSKSSSSQLLTSFPAVDIVRDGSLTFVIPAKAGISRRKLMRLCHETPASAGVTRKDGTRWESSLPPPSWGRVGVGGVHLLLPRRGRECRIPPPLAPPTRGRGNAMCKPLSPDKEQPTPRNPPFVIPAFVY